MLCVDVFAWLRIESIDYLPAHCSVDWLYEARPMLEKITRTPISLLLPVVSLPRDEGGNVIPHIPVSISNISKSGEEGTDSDNQSAHSDNDLSSWRAQGKCAM